MARTSRRQPRYSREDDGSEQTDQEDSLYEHHPAMVFRNEHDEPICFMLHKSLTERRKEELEAKIHRHGGMVMETEAEVDTLIVSGAMLPRKVEQMQMAYACSGRRELRKIWVEKPGFLDTCIGQGRVQHILPRFRGLGNQVARQGPVGPRIFFDTADDYYLARYIASRRPDKEYGGRSGNGLYKTLVDLAPQSGDDNQEYAWVNRHTWQAWRGRYVKNKQYFNAMIEEIVADLPREERIVDPRDDRYGLPIQNREPSFEDDEEIDISPEGNGADEDSDRTDSSRRRHPRSRGHASRTRARHVSRGTDRRRHSWESSPEDRRAPAPSNRPDKGKRRANPPVEESVVAEDHDSLFGDDVANEADDEFPPWSSIQPQGSERTLVGTSSFKSPNLSGTTQPESSSDVHRSTQAGPSQPSSRRVPDTIPKAPAKPPKSKPDRTSSRLVQQTDTVKALKPAVPVATKQVKRKQPDSTGVNDNPPYRNTRSRSRSVEPSAAATHTTSHRGKRTVKTTIVPPAMPEIIEVLDESDVPIGETMKEEQDVEGQLLGVEESVSTMQQLDEDFADAPRQPKSRRRQKKTSGLDSDDQQTHDALTAASGHVDREVDVFGPTVVPTEGPRPPIQQTTQAMSFPQRSARRGRDGGMQAGQRPVRVKLTNSPSRPNVSQPNPESPFPAPGTRAYKLKVHLENQEKSKEYIAPPGTRAAALHARKR